jgi:hypothetical protein
MLSLMLEGVPQGRHFIVKAAYTVVTLSHPYNKEVKIRLDSLPESF